MYKETFTFNEEHITHTTFFTDSRKFGFVDAHSVPGVTLSEKALYAGGWNCSQLDSQKYSEKFKTLKSSVSIIEHRSVLIFKLLVPENGSYEITLKTINESNSTIENMTVFCERRTLVERNISILPDQTYTKTFFAYVLPYIPAMTDVTYTEKAIYISITGLNAAISEISIEQKSVPTIFVAGDSTLTDQNALYPYYPFGSCAGWAQMLPSQIQNVSICNQAHSGMTTTCFRDDGHWNIIKDNIKEGDVVLLQFGHNDQKRRNLSAFGGYYNNLIWYCHEIKKRHAIPVIISPISRLPLIHDNEYYSLLSEYAAACQKVAEQECVPFIDLHSLTFHAWCNLSEDNSHFFMPSDITHTNEYGATLISNLFISEIKKQNIHPLVNWITPYVSKEFLPDFDTEKIPQEPANNFLNNLKIPYKDIDGIDEYDDMIKALQNGLLDPCVMYLHPKDYMPRAQFLMIYLKALRLPGTRPYSNKFKDIKFDEWDSAFVQTCIDYNLIDDATTTNFMFRPDDSLTYEEYASFLMRGMKKGICTLNDSFEQTKSLNLIPSECNPKSYITRAKCYQGLVRLMSYIDTSSLALPAGTEIHPVR